MGRRGKKVLGKKKEKDIRRLLQDGAHHSMKYIANNVGVCEGEVRKIRSMVRNEAVLESSRLRDSSPGPTKTGASSQAEVSDSDVRRVIAAIKREVAKEPLPQGLHHQSASVQIMTTAGHREEHRAAKWLRPSVAIDHVIPDDLAAPSAD